MRVNLRRLTAVAAAATLIVGAVPASAQASPGLPGPKPYVKVGYYTQWSVYGTYPLSKVQSTGQASRLTHLNYAFGTVAADGTCASADPWADWQKPFTADIAVNGKDDVAGQPLSGNLNQLAELKAKNPDLKVLISLGGWSGSAYFSDAALTAASRAKLVSSCVDMWLKGNLPGLTAGAAAGIFDGVDLDWEWPGSDGNAGNVIRPEDKQNFTLLAAEFRKQLDAYGKTTRKHYDLSAFLPAAPAKIDAGFEPSKIFKSLDFGTVQGYDYHGSWETTTNHQSSLFVPKGEPVANDFSADGAINKWVSEGAPRKQLVLGLPYYSQGWTNVTGGGDGLFQPATGVGTANYNVVKALPGFKVYRDLKAGNSWLFDGTSFWTYDDPIQLLEKTAYIRAKGLGGAMMWSLDGDDANGSLTKAVAAGLWTP